jgi:Fur family zinc uptake transcriptional regulator
MTQPRLTRNQALVHGALVDAAGPLSAYAILDRLRDDGFRAPLQVYRALTRLVELGMVHRVESLNAFVACKAPRERHESVVFTICECCGAVGEIADGRVCEELQELAAERGFALSASIVELRGSCRACSSA